MRTANDSSDDNNDSGGRRSDWSATANLVGLSLRELPGLFVPSHWLGVVRFLLPATFRTEDIYKIIQRRHRFSQPPINPSFTLQDCPPNHRSILNSSSCSAFLFRIVTSPVPHSDSTDQPTTIMPGGRCDPVLSKAVVM